jgi:hypothetical protein
MFYSIVSYELEKMYVVIGTGIMLYAMNEVAVILALHIFKLCMYLGISLLSCVQSNCC